MIQSSLFEYLKDNSLDTLVVKDEKEANVAFEVAKYLNFEPFTLPDFRATYGEDLRSYRDELFDLCIVLKNYYNFKGKKLLISPIRIALKKLPNQNLLKSLNLEFGSTIDLNEFKTNLLYFGYEFVDIVEDRAEVSFRGDIIDIFPINSDEPVRISLFDTEVEEIKHFDISNQRTKSDELESIEIYPAPFSFSESEYNSISEEAKDFDENSFTNDIDSFGFWLIKDSIDILDLGKSLFTKGAESELEEIKIFDKIEIKNEIELLPDSKNYKDLIVTNLTDLIEAHSDKEITLLSFGETLVKAYLHYENVKYSQSTAVINLISKNELIISLNKKSKKRKRKRFNLVLDELKKGEFVVHENYGVGIFLGIEQSKILGAICDCVVIKYLGDDKLLIPAQNLDVIDRYIADSGSVPSLDKLGKGSFAKLKAKAKAKILEIANEIVALAAKRELVDGFKITKNSELELFQQSSGFDYTEDQSKAVEDIIKNFSSGKVMDRLLSGDVGFGKTEIAMNAIFLAVKRGYQCAFIAPTTLLSNQHYKSLFERFNQFDIKVAKLDRFVTSRDKKRVLKELEEGEVDIVIGTHSIFSAKFKNIALLIIDEEHKFGVKQKEKLKELKSNAHILSMSATPIPRTLNLALSQVKTFSELKTAPKERKGVKTFVKEANESVLKEIISRELRRAGQIFYVYNRIDTIEAKKIEILRIMPKLKILILHSKISAVATEKEMLAFEQGEYDMLLATSIVESGIHIPNVNTMIIDSSDRFGIADLHQLRGRVGRGTKEGFCYFLVKDREEITEDAKKRLIALESNSHLGSGANLAFHDLQIRGSGNILGTAQSGNIKGVGYSLYLKMLEDAINALTGKHEEKNREIDIKLTVNSFISSDLVLEDRLRLELYRRLSKAKSRFEVSEIEAEIIDRFGKLDLYTKNFLDIIVIKILAFEKGIKSIMNYNQNITFVYNSDEKKLIKSKSRDEDDILKAIFEFLG